MKCFCPTCSQQRNESNTNLKGFVKFYVADIKKTKSDSVLFRALSKEFLDASFRQDKKNKMDLRDRGQLYHSNFFNVKTKTSKVKNPENDMNYNMGIIGEYLFESNDEKRRSGGQLRNIFVKCSS